MQIDLSEQAARCHAFAEMLSHPIRRVKRTRRSTVPVLAIPPAPSYKDLWLAGFHQLGLTSQFETLFEIYMYHLFLGLSLESAHAESH